MVCAGADVLFQSVATPPTIEQARVVASEPVINVDDAAIAVANGGVVTSAPVYTCTANIEVAFVAFAATSLTTSAVGTVGATAVQASTSPVVPPVVALNGARTRVHTTPPVLVIV